MNRLVAVVLGMVMLFGVLGMSLHTSAGRARNSAFYQLQERATPSPTPTATPTPSPTPPGASPTPVPEPEPAPSPTATPFVFQSLDRK